MPPSGGEYDPSVFASLAVSKEVKDLFLFITAHTPNAVELETRLKPFIPDYLPALGEIDPFLKIPRPDGRPDALGLSVLDEPTSKPAIPAVVKMEIAAREKRSVRATFVQSIDDALKRPALIERWVAEIDTLRKKRPPPTVHYSRPMPEVDALMQEWPADIEDALVKDGDMVPPAKIDLNVLEYAQMVCGVCDIPVQGNIIESLHLLFTLYAEFRSNQHFMRQGDDAHAATAGSAGGAAPAW